MRYLSLILLLFCAKISIAQENLNHPLHTEDVLQQQKWVDSIYNSMTVKDRIGQLFMVQVMSKNSDKDNAAVFNLVKEEQIGGIIYSNGGPYRQAKLNNQLELDCDYIVLVAQVTYIINKSLKDLSTSSDGSENFAPACSMLLTTEDNTKVNVAFPWNDDSNMTVWSMVTIKNNNI